MYDVIIIGAGQAGLAVGYYLSQRNKSFIILERNASVGDSWVQRYDSLHLFTPRRYNSLPGFDFPGKLDGFPSKDEAALYLKAYTKEFNLPVRTSEHVLSISRENGGFQVNLTSEQLFAHQVVIATGPFQEPAIPQFASSLPEVVNQMHSSEYRNASQLHDGSVLVVGAGNSGAQIACELTATHDVHLAASKSISQLPLTLLGRSIFWYFDKAGLMKAHKSTAVGKWLRKKPEYVYGNELRNRIRENKIIVHPRAVRADGKRITFSDQRSIEVSNVIWATGFKRNDAWIRIPGAFDSDGQIRHTDGVSSVQGLYYIGMQWQTSRGSSLLGWVKIDAQKIADKICEATEQA
ncbi:flavin-containing monooxygenase [Paenibacillus sp. B01]|uniref:flavin-containing monooxygenase n=1 Tax=Paenibacillus sp. B01 TaxID=2660554 RepID=UPI00129BE95A|nr:NAD(P)/FAD-dependent oxidoreductase [Paenibacillus sp. B01]QGG55037.1 SidA/IucD/PvdA family monooxygenase [Paenibacillus sp. B01]